ncbi:myotubularin-related protein 7a [Girardinichthys multiradiatus]|uniref:myotubularin-related protein 7a n=1 Tax=Girardinichthys multiradiatus TaxID=208333 RepID=UPI001FAE0A4E|nr:myotubularin-related protein 7a [Girardinichthys multiradiatus]
MEHIRLPKVENVRLLDRVSPRKSRVGTLYLTATHSIFVESEAGGRSETWVLHSLVSSVDKQAANASGCPLLIRCKNFQILHFSIPREQDCHDVYLSMQRLSQAECYEELYCFSYKPSIDEEERRREWAFVDLKSDYRRMGLPNSLWKLSPVNQHYKVSDTYPDELFVPESATHPILVGSSKFRSRGRFPALSYYSKENHAAICRSSQPLSGFSARCLEDEQMLEATLKSNPRSDFMYVVDTRPKLNAIANRAAGKGYENEDNYSNIKFQFMGIENIHVMRNSQQKMLEVCELRSPSMSDFLEGLESSGWLKHIKAVLDTGVFIAKAVAEGVSVLVHCSDGWDRTAQVCSVACVLLDPYYRTLKGLMVLIEKDWVSFGHKFTQRCNHLVRDSKEVSPIIDQFLECVWQLMEQFPCAFEYNERLLITVHNHIYSCQFGNFIGNNQRERKELRVHERTHSLWSYLWTNRAEFINPLYRQNHSQSQGLLRPSTAPYCFKFWRGLYNHFDCGMHPRQSVEDYLRVIREETQQLEEQLDSHKQKIAQLEQEQGWSDACAEAIFDKSPTVWVFGKNLALANTPQDYTGSFLTSSPCTPKAPGSPLILPPQDSNQTVDSNLSNSSDQESGIADLSCRSPLSEDSTRDPDSDEAAYSAA